MTTPNMQIVDLILDCQNFAAEAYAARELRHEDGRLFTAEEHELAGQATRVELVAVRDYEAKVTEHYRERHAALGELAELLAPYYARYGDATVGELRQLMTPDDLAQLDRITSRIHI